MNFKTAKPRVETRGYSLLPLRGCKLNLVTSGYEFEVAQRAGVPRAAVLALKLAQRVDFLRLMVKAKVPFD